MSTTTEVKKTAVTKKPKSPKTTSHPTYFEMIKEALLALHEKSGSSPHAIAKHMEEKHKAVLPSNFRRILAVQLKNSAAKGKLIKVKASFKLSEAAKNVAKPKPKTNKAGTETKKATTKVAAVKPKTNKSTAVKAKKATPVKPAKKRAAPKKIKSPAAKKAKKATKT